MTSPPTAADRMERSRGVVDALLHSAQLRALGGSAVAAVVLLTAAATVSRRRHTGCFTDATLEAHLRLVAEGLRSSSTARAKPGRAGTPSGASSGVLHVMTRGYATGGHTRLVERWIAGEPSVVSSVVFTQPEGGRYRGALTELVGRSGGSLHHLEGSALERVQRLQSLAAGRDRLVLSTHENDVVALLALAGMQQRPPVLVVNHAEHVYWAGASIADVVVSLRPASSELATARRGIPPSRCVQVPLPIQKRPRATRPGDARRALGIPAEDKVLLTVGWQYKYTPYSGHDLLAALAPILDEADVHLIAVGPRADSDHWSPARSRFNGRVRAVGPQQQIEPYLDAADVFVDSYPIASLTAALDAATSGLPVVGLSPRDARWPSILREDDPALVGSVFDDPDEYRARIRRLLRHESAWCESSDSLQELSIRSHGQEAWTSAMHRVDEALAGALHDRQPSSPLAPLGSPGVEDDILATYIADCEDRLIRPELRLSFDDHVDGDRGSEALVSHVRRIDELLLQPAAPSAAEYEEALQCARDSASACVHGAGQCRA